jgi:hypothetical protein
MNLRASITSALQAPEGALPEPGPTAEARLLATFAFHEDGANVTDEFGRTLAEAFEDEKTRQPLNLRQRRRAYERGQRTAQRKAGRNYVRKEIDRQNTATDLAQFFNIIDGHVPSRPIVRARMRLTVARKVAAVVEADQARYDKEITARQADRSLPAPKPPIRREDVEMQLRGVAKTATTYAPKTAV